MQPLYEAVILCPCVIIPTPHHDAYFAQFDWLEKKFYILINSMSRNLGTTFLPPAPKMYNKIDKNKLSKMNNKIDKNKLF